MFNIVNKQTGQVVSKNIKSRASAIKTRDRKDNAYGAYVHMIVRVEQEQNK